MRCPTCGHGVRRDQEICSFCGAFLGDAFLAEGKGGEVSGAKETEAATRWPAAPSTETMEPELMEEEEPAPAPAPHAAREEAGRFRRMEAEELAPVEGPFKASPKAPPGAPPARPQLSGLLRLLFPLLFILIPLLNMLLRDSPFRAGSDERPVLQQALFCENIAEGRPVNPKTVFSLRQNQRVALYTRWSGSRGRHSYSFRWYTPQGNLLPASSSVTRFQFRQGEDVFSTYAFLPLNAGMPLGRWRVEIAVDRVVQAQPSFELRE